MANMDNSRFNGLRSLTNVRSFLFPLLDPPNLGNCKSRKTPDQSGCRTRILLAFGVH